MSKCRRAFLSGPVSGLDYVDAVVAFHGAKRWCAKIGFGEVFVPVDEVPRDATHADAMRRCIRELTEYDVAIREGGCGDPVPYYDLLVSLPGWEASDGATLERQVAEAVGIPCVELGELGGDE